MKTKGAKREALSRWAANQRALARALGLSLEDWMDALDAAGRRRTGVYAAAVGAAVSRGLGLAVLSELDASALASRARALIDPRPPRVRSPLLAEAVRRQEELGVRAGAARLRKKRVEREALPTPTREVRPLGQSATVATPDAPGSLSAPRASRPRRKIAKRSKRGVEE